MNTAKRIEYYSRAGYPALYIPTHEDQRVSLEILKGLQAITKTVEGEEGELPDREIFAWSCTKGLEGISNERDSSPDLVDPDEVLQLFINKARPGSVFVLNDVHLYLDDAPPMLIRLLKDAMEHAKMCQKMLIIIGCRTVLPPEIEKLVTLVDFKLPTRDELAEIVLDPLAQTLGIELTEDERKALAAAGSGLTSYEFENALALSYIQNKREHGEVSFSASVVYREKVQTVKKNGLAEVVEANIEPDHLGGLDLFKDYMSKRGDLFSEEAEQFGIKMPKGVLLVGTPGCGKSLSAKICPVMLGRIPLLRVDMGRMFAGIVGASEQNMRNMLDLAEAVSPCVLWIDEIERALSGGESSGKTDGGTTDRIIGTLLTWMEEKTKPVFVFATGNDITSLPAQLLRRFDDLWFVDLPNTAERYEIWRIHMSKTGRNPDDFDLKLLVEETKNWTGSEIETLWNDSLVEAFATKERKDLHTLEICKLAKSRTPLSEGQADKIEHMRKWAEKQARPATTPINKHKRERMAARMLN